MVAKKAVFCRRGQGGSWVEFRKQVSVVGVKDFLFLSTAHNIALMILRGQFRSSVYTSLKTNTEQFRHRWEYLRTGIRPQRHRA